VRDTWVQIVIFTKWNGRPIYSSLWWIHEQTSSVKECNV